MDDSKQTLDVCQYILCSRGYDMKGFTDKAAGYDWLAENPAGLIIFDLMSPGMSGLQLLSHLELSPFTRSIPRVCVSARPSPELAQSLLRRGVWSYLLKPHDLDDLLNIVREVFDVGPVGSTQQVPRATSATPFLSWHKVTEIWRMMLEDLGATVTAIEETRPWCLDFFFNRGDLRCAGRVIRPFDIVGSVEREVASFAEYINANKVAKGVIFPLLTLEGDREAAKKEKHIFVTPHTLTAALMRNTRRRHLKRILGNLETLITLVISS